MQPSIRSVAAAILVSASFTACFLGSGTGTGTGNGNGAGSGQVGQACGAKDHCAKGGACNLDTHICDEVGTDQCGPIGSDCCPPSSAAPNCSAGGTCVGSVCQPCGHKGELCCPGFNIAECTCDPGLTSSGVDCQ